MKDILKNLFKRELEKVPDSVRFTFSQSFPEAINEDWSIEGKYWEVVFYHNQKEKIAKFSKDGQLEELRTNVALSELPEAVNVTLSTRGEIMNAIKTQKNKTTTWEIIYRNDKLIRCLCNLDENGQEMSNRQL